MQEIIHTLFGQGHDLNVLQMSMRTLVIFIICLLLIRLSGRRSFGMRMPLDNVVTILLGAILSRAVTGASPFLPIVASATTFALLHRLCAWLGWYSKFFSRVVQGREFILYENGKPNMQNLKRCMVNKDDLMEGVRINSNLNDLENTDKIFMESNGEISVVKKEN